MPTTSPAGIAATVVAFLGVLAAYVILALNGQDPAGLMAAIVPVLAALGVAGHVEKRTQQQNERIAKIDRQTNGVLDERILIGTTKAVRKVLRDAGIDVPAPSDPIDPIDPID